MRLNLYAVIYGNIDHYQVAPPELRDHYRPQNQCYIEVPPVYDLKVGKSGFKGAANASTHHGSTFWAEPNPKQG